MVTAISYHSVRPQCFIYRTPNRQIIELHNEHTNAFVRIELEGSFYKKCLLAELSKCGVLAARRDSNTRWLCWLLMDLVLSSMRKVEAKVL